MDGPLPSFRWDGNCGPVRPEVLCPEWSYLKQFREADAHIKRQKEDFDRRHRARNMPPLQPETYAWLKYDSLTDTRVSAPAAAPRSYIVEGEGSRTIRRNRRDITAVPSEDEAAQREGDRHVPAARDDGAVFTRYGREVKAPDRLNL